MKRILLADDSQQALRLGERILGGQGIEVVSVTDGATVLDRLSDVDPDVIITDVFLPVKNGFELARFIKAQPEWKHVRVVFAAGLTDEFNEQDAKNAGAEAILRKPFEASALVKTIEPLIEQSQVERAPKGTSSPGVDNTTIRAAVTIALESAMPVLIEELTGKVILAVRQSLVRNAAVVTPAPAAPAIKPPSSDTLPGAEASSPAKPAL
jgi:PleD family two-component response regulator